ncbi:hypothetical protein EDC19_0708 [Natranaerovirga hydrolytica]|uniref:Uncharacterized protein n=1 Tax=Natranaerovirga hydrolytica TaxID=680378 RepID=A0A4R1MYC2_9FIRM|nr:hypothetical protein EDC19_0708 [Natranaerovirga hydrolytica]
MVATNMLVFVLGAIFVIGLLIMLFIILASRGK